MLKASSWERHVMTEPSRVDDETSGGDIPTAKPFIPAYFQPLKGGLVTLTQMNAMEAELACTKIQSEGIPCFVADRNWATGSYNAILCMASVQVHESDLERARAILDRPPAQDMEGEYVEEDWRCPKCHRKTIDVMPMSRFWKRVFLLFLGLIVVPLALELVGRAIPEQDWLPSFESLGGFAGPAWIIALATLALTLIFRPRQKHCTSCGHTWKKGSDAGDA
jgi:hypothetical protein